MTAPTETRQPWTCATCKCGGVLVRPAAQDALSDWHQIEEQHAIAAPECPRLELRLADTHFVRNA